MSRAGTILRVNLTDGRIEKEPTSTYVKNYIGGGAIGAKIISDAVPPDVSGFDPQNLLTFNAGPLTGTLLGNKCEVMTKSPELINNTLVTAGMGGQFASEMKFAGYDHIVIQGQSDVPVYLCINNEDVEIRDARHLWGLGTGETQQRIKEELRDPEVQIACIGPAGENRVVYALIIHDIQNAASKGGFGAVMGAKKLKAVAVRGTKSLKIADPEAFMGYWREYWDYYTKGRGRLFASLNFREGLSVHIQDHGKYKDVYPYGYYDTYVSPPMKKEDTAADFVKKYMVGHIGCAFCPVQCQQNFSVPGIANGGSACMNYEGYRFLVKGLDPKLWWKASAKAQQYGIDTVSMGSITGWLMLLFEKGVITAADTEGVPMEWASEEAVMTVIDKVCRKEGFGALFADGIVPAAREIAGGMGLEYAVQSNNRLSTPSGAPGGPALFGAGLVKGTTQMIWLHPAAFDMHGIYPWYAKELGVSYDEAQQMVEDWASDFTERVVGNRNVWKGQSVQDTARYIIASEDAIASCDISGHCDFLSDRAPQFGCRTGIEEIPKWLTAATGTTCTSEKLLEVLHRKRLLELSYNLLCEKMMGQEQVRTGRPLRDGYWKGKDIPDPAMAIQVGTEYYQLRGCDPSTGIPTRQTLERLDLKNMADMLESAFGDSATDKNNPGAIK